MRNIFPGGLAVGFARKRMPATFPTPTQVRGLSKPLKKARFHDMRRRVPFEERNGQTWNSGFPPLLTRCIPSNAGQMAARAANSWPLVH
jgi:hypothetical protein